MNPLATEDTSWGSHLVPLMACVTATRGAVLEVGVGHWSTPLLHAYCAAAGRTLISIDEDRAWVERFKEYHIGRHTVEHANYGDYLRKMAEKQFSVVFLDGSPGHTRADQAMLFRESANLIVIHDYSGAEVADPFKAVLDEWPYRAVARFSPSCLILGNIPIPDFEKRIDV